jgi:hypothetical protein
MRIMDARKGALTASCARFTVSAHGWLGRQDSNLGMAESKSKWFALFTNARSEKSREFDLNPFKSLADISECRMHVARSDDDALPSEGRGHKFESCRARHEINDLMAWISDAATRGYHMATNERCPVAVTLITGPYARAAMRVTCHHARAETRTMTNRRPCCTEPR